MISDFFNFLKEKLKEKKELIINFKDFLSGCFEEEKKFKKPC